MCKNDIQVAALQKIFLSQNYTLCNRPDYTMNTQNRPKERDKGGGLSYIVHNMVRHGILELRSPNPDNQIEEKAIECANAEKNSELVNVYIPPQFSCATGYTAALKHLLTPTDRLIVCD